MEIDATISFRKFRAEEFRKLIEVIALIGLIKYAKNMHYLTTFLSLKLML